MGRLNRRHTEAARAGAESVPATRAEKELRRRGVLVPLSVLAERSVAECIDAISWANNARPLELRPGWIGELVAAGRASEVEIVDLCAEGLCMNVAAVSYIHPNTRTRFKICAEHLEALRLSAQRQRISVEPLDIQPIGGSTA